MSDDIVHDENKASRKKKFRKYTTRGRKEENVIIINFKKVLTIRTLVLKNL